MNLIIRLVIISLTAIGFFGCSTEVSEQNSQSSLKPDGQILQGEIVYSVEFPFIDDPTLLKWFPTEYTTRFNETEIYGEMNSRMNVITNRFYSNQKTLELKQTLENMSGNFVSKLNKIEVDEMVGLMPDMIIKEPHGDTTIVGLKCKIAIAEFKLDSVPPVTIYYTDQIRVQSPNWFNQYRGTDKFLLGYEVEQFGMRMKLMAKKLEQKSPNISSDLIYAAKDEQAYKTLSGLELKNTFKDMLIDFMQ